MFICCTQYILNSAACKGKNELYARMHVKFRQIFRDHIIHQQPTIKIKKNPSHVKPLMNFLAIINMVFYTSFVDREALLVLSSGISKAFEYRELEFLSVRRD